jgi:ferric-dicitrate binding protein FerR (iron transport regulator)
MTELNQNIDFEVIWKKIHGQASPEEEALLDEWVARNPSHRKYYDNAVRYYTKGTQFANTSAELKKALNKIYRKAGIHNPYRNTTIIAITSIAASVLLLIYFQFSQNIFTGNIIDGPQAQSIVPGSNKAVLILDDGSQHDLTSGQNTIIDADGAKIKNSGNSLEYVGSSGQTTEPKYNTLKIPRGGEYFIVLSDSTRVWLNSETILRFPVQFAGDIRRVELSGEAYFEVAKNAEVPFVVVSDNQQIKVLGTQFNVSSYPDDQQISTTLVEGKVDVSLAGNPETHIVLKPSEQGQFSKENNQMAKRIVDVTPFVAWKDGRFVFHDQPLQDIMKTLSKWYDVEVVFANEGDKSLRFTGNLERYAEFGSILAKIERTNEVEFEIINNVITIK